MHNSAEITCPKPKVVAAMSGGVDSSVAALLLARTGYEVVGVSMQVWDYRNNGGSCSRATCCSPQDFTDARIVASRIGIPYYVVDFEKHFKAEVIDGFVGMYEAGLTPNPCVDCNNKVKFAELRRRARSFGCEAVATGHYARIEKGHEGLHLYRARDRGKDQSYFLYNLTPSELSHTIFPLGSLSKTEVRELAREAGLLTAEKPESQDICFVSGSVKDFLVRLGKKAKLGSIVTVDGTKVGEHDGIHGFTVGQRRGLNLGGFESPLYVVGIDAEENLVIVGRWQELERPHFSVAQVSWVSPALNKLVSAGEFPQKVNAVAQIRYRHAGCAVELEILSADDVKVRFLDGWSAVSPGQAAVFYDSTNEEVLGGGRIVHERWWKKGSKAFLLD